MFKCHLKISFQTNFDHSNVFGLWAPHCKSIFRENICYYRNLPQILERKVYAASTGFYHRYVIDIRYLWFFPSVSEKRSTSGQKLWLEIQQSVQQINKFSSPHPYPHPFFKNELFKLKKNLSTQIFHEML